MKIQFKSDLHHEFTYGKTRIYDPAKLDEHYINPEADVIVLAGDITIANKLHIMKQYYGNIDKPVLWVPGNHEYYEGSTATAKEEMKKAVEGTNIRCLDRDFYIQDNTVFIGATLWTSLSSPIDQRIWMANMNEPRLVKHMDPQWWTNAHIEDRQFIENCLKNPDWKDYKKVVITHFLPSYQSVPERFINDANNCSFVAPCESLMMDYKPDIWNHGHTHDSCDYTVHETRVLCNPYGYWGYVTNKQFNPNLIVEL